MDRLLELLRQANLPIQYLTGSNKDDIGIAYSQDPTDEIKKQVQTILDSFDWSYEAEQAWLLKQKKNEAIDKINSDEPNVILYRNSLRYVAQGFNVVVAKLNEVIDAHNLKTGDTIEKLPPVSTWDDLLRFVQILITRE